MDGRREHLELVVAGPVARASRPQLKLPDARGSALTVT